MIAAAALRVGDHVGPGEHRVAEPLLGLPVHLQQDAADVRVADPGGGVGVPGEGGAARAAARLVLGSIRTDRGIVGLLGLPGDDPVADVDLPRARAGAVHAVGGSHDLVMTPPVPVEDVAGPAAFEEGHPAVVGLIPAGEEAAQRQQGIGCFAVDTGSDRGIHTRTLTIGSGVAEVAKVTGLLYARMAGIHPLFESIYTPCDRRSLRSRAPGMLGRPSQSSLA